MKLLISIAWDCAIVLVVVVEIILVSSTSPIQVKEESEIIVELIKSYMA